MVQTNSELSIGKNFLFAVLGLYTTGMAVDYLRGDYREIRGARLVLEEASGRYHDVLQKVNADDLITDDE